MTSQPTFRSQRAAPYWGVETDYRARDFGVRDAKGRKCGAYARTHRVEFVAVPDEARVAANVEPGTYYELYCHATRDGVSYGGGDTRKLYRTPEEAAAAAKAYFARAAKRAITKFGEETDQ